MKKKKILSPKKQQKLKSIKSKMDDLINTNNIVVETIGEHESFDF